MFPEMPYKCFHDSRRFGLVYFKQVLFAHQTNQRIGSIELTHFVDGFHHSFCTSICVQPIYNQYFLDAFHDAGGVWGFCFSCLRWAEKIEIQNPL